jgi:hypothetical protein
MEIKNQILALALLGVFMISPVLKPIQADNASMVEILNPQVQPAEIKVGDSFAINATIANNSNDTISVHNDCSGAFTVVFDNHVTAGPKKVCNFMAIQIILKPGENTTVSSLHSVLGFTAVSPGTTNATVTISYIVANKTGPNLSFEGNPINSSKSFLFEISNQTVQMPPVTPSPLQQFKSGTAAEDVKCKTGLELVIKIEDGSPACVSLQTATSLVARAWGTFVTQPT